ncbi:MAG: hypothetical protein LRY73_19560 [Bacillus sp. (in: Bacteria)]|nr:hypothetical protein [Bacillus sp. (in: firmicutes)]
MMNYTNKVAKALTVVAVIIGLIVFILGIVAANHASNMGTPAAGVFTSLLSYWFAGFVAALFFVALAEIIQQLEKLNFQFARSSVANPEPNKTEDTANIEGNNSDEKPDDYVPTYKDYKEAWAWTIGIGFLFIIFLIAFGTSR